MTNRAAYVFGVIYGIAANLQPEHARSPIKTNVACMYPARGYSEAIKMLDTKKAMAPWIEDELQTLLEDVDISDFESSDKTISLETQGHWQVGYYKGQQIVIKQRQKEYAIKHSAKE